ncbi:hypothetical protein Y032_0853g2693 [Ancylostoma ceylanicum]|uniref:SCP domain-containing protein n=1 Tax=Ancylostoma ceylanicum TaxID=53326 RepID=A0A016WB41_9BILA|nr:hypothetical protein Y032_0853g2693 [Ancylostoma ceylanicum]
MLAPLRPPDYPCRQCKAVAMFIPEYSAQVYLVVSVIMAISLLFAAICSHAKATTAFGCKNSLISDEWREAVLSFHNKNRRKLAEGGLVDSKNAKMDVAKDMQKLYWDCNMEDQAWQKVKDCPTPPTTIGTYGVSEEVVSTKKNCNATTVTDTTLKTWWKELKTKYDSAAATMKYVADQIPHFGVMAYSKSKAFACTYQPCTGSLHLICVYSENGADPNNKIYDAGAPMCDSCAQTCTEALCPDKPDPAKDLDTAICGQANLDKMSDDLRNTALDMHNYNRRLLATGWAEDKQIGYAKTAAKMPVLVRNFLNLHDIPVKLREHIDLYGLRQEMWFRNTAANLKTMQRLTLLSVLMLLKMQTELKISGAATTSFLKRMLSRRFICSGISRTE